MHKMWNFSTLQRPTQEEKERRRKYKEDKIRHANTLLPKSKVGRAKTFRERNNNEFDYQYDQEFGPEDLGPVSLPVSASMVEVLRHRAKSSSRAPTSDNYNQSSTTTLNKKPQRSKDRDHSAHSGFVSRLRFLDSALGHDMGQSGPKLRWQDREPSSGYSSGGRGGQDNGDQTTSDDNIYGVKFSSMPPEVFLTSSRKG